MLFRMNRIWLRVMAVCLLVPAGIWYWPTRTWIHAYFYHVLLVCGVVFIFALLFVLLSDAVNQVAGEDD